MDDSDTESDSFLNSRKARFNQMSVYILACQSFMKSNYSTKYITKPLICVSIPEDEALTERRRCRVERTTSI